MADNKLERIYTIPLWGAYEHVRTKRTRRAVKLVRSFIVRHMKPEDEEGVKMSAALNDYLWQRGIQKPPRRVKIRAVRDGTKVHVSLADEKPPAEKKAKEPKKTPEAKKEEPKKDAKEETKHEHKAGEKHDHQHEDKKHEHSKKAEHGKEGKGHESMK